MGFQRTPRIRRMTFDEGSDFPGLVMKIGGLSLDEWHSLKYPEAFDLFADRLMEWNWEDENGGPVPPTREGVGSLDAEDMRTLIGVWADTVATRRVVDPLLVTVDDGTSQPSTNGSSGAGTPDTSFEGSIPMSDTGSPSAN